MMHKNVFISTFCFKRFSRSSQILLKKIESMTLNMNLLTVQQRHRRPVAKLILSTWPYHPAHQNSNPFKRNAVFNGPNKLK